MKYDIEIRKAIVRKVQIEAEDLDTAHAIGLSMLDGTSDTGYELEDAYVSVFENEDNVISLDAYRTK